jgi:hypothetical protein
MLSDHLDSAPHQRNRAWPGNAPIGPPNLIRSGSFSLDRLLSHIDPGTVEESEDFVSRIYEQRYIDLSSDCNGKTGR